VVFSIHLVFRRKVDMRMAFLTAATLAALTLSGIARADVYISETINGTVASNGILGFGIDFLGDFGPAGADLTGAAVSLSFSYDYTEILDAPINGPDAADVTDSVTINNQTVSFTNNFPGSFGGVTDYLGVLGGTPPTLVTGIENSTNTPYVSIFVFGANNLPLADVGDQAAVDAFIATPGSFMGGNEYIQISNGTSNDEINVVSTSSTTTPEPASRIPLALGLGGIAVLKFRGRRAHRS
jgi:hypothetical protein